MSDVKAPSFADLLASVLTDPGLVSAAFSRFHNYSLGNQILALTQCLARGIAPGPMATFPGWKDKGRFVRKGEKAIVLCQPVTVKRDTDNGNEPEVFTRFIYRPSWFVLAQTEGAEYVPPVVPEWDANRAFIGLQVAVKYFDAMNGNVGGYARERTITVNPTADNHLATTLHELAHIVLGHTTVERELPRAERTPRDIREVEAESVAYLVLSALNQPGVEYCRGYIQGWAQGKPIDDRTAQRIFKAADQILKAGRPAEEV